MKLLSLFGVIASLIVLGVVPTALVPPGIKFAVQQGRFRETGRVWTCDSPIACKSNDGTITDPPRIDDDKTTPIVYPLTLKEMKWVGEDICTADIGDGQGYVPQTLQPGNCLPGLYQSYSLRWDYQDGSNRQGFGGTPIDRMGNPDGTF